MRVVDEFPKSHQKLVFTHRLGKKAKIPEMIVALQPRERLPNVSKPVFLVPRGGLFVLLFLFSSFEFQGLIGQLMAR